MAVQLKGSPDGIRVICDPVAPEERILDSLQEQFDKAGRFLQGARLQIELGERPLTSSLVEGVLALLARYPSLSLGSIGSGPAPRGPRRRSAVPTAVPPRVLRQTIRSGQELVHGGDLVIIGDVNSGAAVRAGGDLIVLGALRGTAQAGLQEDPTRLIYAHLLRPTQLRLGPYIAVDPGHPPSGIPGRHPPSGIPKHHAASPSGPETARVVGEQIVVEPWKGRLPGRSRRSVREAMA